MKALALSMADRIEVRPGPLETPCWVWTGATNENGYGVLVIGGKSHYAHRIAYQLFRGPITYQKEPDHLCRTPACICPWHLELVTSRENSLRGNHPLFVLHREKRCKQGHSVTGENVIHRKDGRVRCKICNQKHTRDARRRIGA